MIKIDINQRNTILIHSYLSEDGRQVEKDCAASKAYEWLKMQPQFVGAEDI